LSLFSKGFVFFRAASQAQAADASRAAGLAQQQRCGACQIAKGSPRNDFVARVRLSSRLEETDRRVHALHRSGDEAAWWKASSIAVVHPFCKGSMCC
jgi:hypothetical protein